MTASARQRAMNIAREYWLTHPVFIDTETTGLHAGAEIVEISIVDHDGSVLLDTLVKPMRSIPWDAIRVHGITDEMVRQAPTWAEVQPVVEATVMDRYVGIYNADFDLRMIRQSNRLHGLTWQFQTGRFFCIMKLYTQFRGFYRWQTLDAAGRQCGISIPNAHRAKEDALLARAVMHYMASVRA